MSRGSSVGLTAIAAVLALSTSAVAQPAGQAAATAAFDRGRALMKDNKYAEACAAFESSQKLDPQWGTLYNLAGCYVKTGKLASAWAAYRELAQRDTNPARRKESDKQARALDRRLPRLLLTSPSKPPGIAITLDGADVTGLLGTESPVDLGSHAIHATAPDRMDFDKTTTITEEGKTVTVVIRMPPAEHPRSETKAPEPAVAAARSEDEPAAKSRRTSGSRSARSSSGSEDAESDAAESDAARSRRRMYGVIVAAGGGALVVTGLVVGRLASSKWDQAKALCGNDLTCDNPDDLAKGNQLVSDAQLRANLSTGLVIGGIAAIGIGAALFLTAPSETRSRTALHLVPGAAPGAVSLTLVGRY